MSIKNKSFFLYSTGSKNKPENEREKNDKWFKPFICTECGEETRHVYTRGTCFEDVKERYKTEKLCAKCAIQKIRTTFADAKFEIVKRASTYRMNVRVLGKESAYCGKAFLTSGLVGCHRQNLWLVRNAEDNQKITWKMYFIRMIKYLLRIKEKEDVNGKRS